MDIPRDPKRKGLRRWMIGGGALATLLFATVALARLEPAAPTVDRGGVWVDTVRYGTMVRQVRGPGTLVSEQTRFITAMTAGRVERLLLVPGTTVTPESQLLILSNPEVQLQAMEAQRQLASTQSQLVGLRATLENQRLNQEAAVASALSQYREANRQVEANRALAEANLIPMMELNRSQDIAEEMGQRLEIEQKRLEFLAASMDAQVQAQMSELERLQALVTMQQTYVASLAVTAGTGGTLRELTPEEGQWVNPGSPLAVVVQSGRLKAELRIPETQMRDVVVGQQASIDTRVGIIPGRVTRIDPAVVNGSVTVDVALEGELPRGARPDLSIDGTIEIERLDNVLHTSRPAYGQPEGTVGLFKLDPDERYARRTVVGLGRSSVNTIEIRSGLQEGDIVILSDMSQWDAVDRVRLR